MPVVEDPFDPAILELVAFVGIHFCLEELKVVSKSVKKAKVRLWMEDLTPVHSVVVLLQDLLNFLDSLVDSIKVLRMPREV